MPLAITSEGLTAVQMLVNSFSDVELIHRFGRSYPDVDVKMIQLRGTIEINQRPHQAAEPSCELGKLSCLPVETICMVVQNLDFYSLCRFTEVSRRARDIVRSLPAYRQLVRLIPSVLLALAKTRMIGVHSLEAIYEQFKSTTCTSCGDTGGFFFLLTCDRCCYMCLHNNKDLWALSVQEAKHLFKMSPEDLGNIPQLFSLRGTYLEERSKRMRLVSFKHARYAAGQRYHPAQRMITANFKTSRSKCWGMASMLFPHLESDGCVERAYWCELCSRLRLAQTSALHRHQWIRLGTLRLSGSSDAELGRLFDNECHDWTKGAFIEHVRSCDGVQFFAPMP